MSGTVKDKNTVEVMQFQRTSHQTHRVLFEMHCNLKKERKKEGNERTEWI